MAEKHILHLLTPLKHMSPLDVLAAAMFGATGVVGRDELDAPKPGNVHHFASWQ